MTTTTNATSCTVCGEVVDYGSRGDGQGVQCPVTGREYCSEECEEREATGVATVLRLVRHFVESPTRVCGAYGGLSMFGRDLVDRLEQALPWAELERLVERMRAEDRGEVQP